MILGVAFAAVAWVRLRSFQPAASGAAGSQPAEVITEPPPPQENEEIRRAESPPLHRAPAARAREARYEELLRSAPPPAPGGTAPSATPAPVPVKKAAASPTLIDRVVKPIASALGFNRSNPQAPQAVATRPHQPPATSTGETTSTEAQSESDAESDVTPPRLLSVEFVPAQVQDGEQTTFAAFATDDKSGVRGITGVISSPSGAQQGFACQREGERFVSRINVPREAAEGRWSVKYLTITDNVGNTLNLHAGQGLPPNAGFNVTSSASDSKGPVLKAVWLDAQSMAAGEKNQVFVQAEDDRSGVNLVTGVFISPSRQARIGFGCRFVNAMWQCPITPPACVDCGTWTLEQIQLQDKANNMTTVRADNELVGAVRMELFGEACDKTPPVLTALSVDPPSVSNTTGGIIRATAVATDSQCGVASLSGVAWPPPASKSSARVYFPFRPTDEQSTTFVGEIKIEPGHPSGTWTIGWVQALDKGHNSKSYTPGSEPIVARVTFTVE